MSNPKPMLDALANKVRDYPENRSHLERFEAAVRAEERERVARAIETAPERSMTSIGVTEFIRGLK